MASDDHSLDLGPVIGFVHRRSIHGFDRWSSYPFPPRNSSGYVERAFAVPRFLRHFAGMAFIINGARIGNDVIEEEFESLKEHYLRLGEAVCCDRDAELRAYAQDNVINRTLLEQESVKRFGEIDDATVEARFEELKAEHGGDQAFYDNTGFNRGDRKVILDKLRSSLTVDRLLEAEVKVPVNPSEEELENYYQENLDQFMGQEEVRVSQLFIEPSSHEAAREAYVALRQVRKELLAGKDFDEAAREHGSDEEREIDLGWMKQGQTMPEVEAITFSMEIGEISPIVATHYGFHLFKVTDRKEAKPIPRVDISGLEERYLSDRRSEGIADLIDRLKSTSSIEEVPEEAPVAGH